MSSLRTHPWQPTAGIAHHQGKNQSHLLRFNIDSLTRVIQVGNA